MGQRMSAGMRSGAGLLVFCAAVAAMVFSGCAWGQSGVSETARNLLLDVQVSGNLASFGKGLRGAPDHMIYDVQKAAFLRSSQWHEYGVGYGADLGVVSESQPAWWMAQWAAPVQVNLIALSGAYENQPQPETGWKIELRRNGHWTTHEQGVGGWYDRGYYLWG
ncbi:MAG: hypothetical protein IH624_16990, partial [Phycisphaerae bacterium]|nr:hypothetical protein [Phycisphaerae bacterium]